MVKSIIVPEASRLVLLLCDLSPTWLEHYFKPLLIARLKGCEGRVYFDKATRLFKSTMDLVDGPMDMQYIIRDAIADAVPILTKSDEVIKSLQPESVTSVTIYDNTTIRLELHDVKYSPAGFAEPPTPPRVPQ